MNTKKMIWKRSSFWWLLLLFLLLSCNPSINSKKSNFGENRADQATALNPANEDLRPVSFAPNVSASISSLSYELGGPSQVDPGKGRTNVYYVDSVAGNDRNHGRSPADAWKSVDVVSANRETFQPGTMILFKRGGDWRPKWAILNKMIGTIDRPITLGAYGELNLARPRIHAMIEMKYSSHVMLRDLDFIKVETTGAKFITIYNNIVHGSKETGKYLSNGIQAWGGSSHIAIVSNFIYDIAANDALGVHGGADMEPFGHVWMVDNVVIGNSGMEDGIDLSMGDSTIDVKAVGNQVTVQSVPGVSTLTGRGGMMINGGHGGRYLWYIGNTLGYSGGQGVKQAGDRRDIQFSGNVIIEAGKNSVELYALGDSVSFRHNTIIQSSNSTPIAMRDGQVDVFKNLVFKTGKEGLYIANWYNSATLTADHNWYGPATGLSFNYKSFSAWQALGYDLNSSVGNIPGISIPAKTTFNSDPRNWKSSSFLKQFVPDSTFRGCSNQNTPGAFDCQGQRLGMEILPMKGLDNEGLGWPGPALVQAKLSEMNIQYGKKPALPLAVTLLANPTSISLGNSSTLTWTSTNATSCTGKGFSTGNKLAGSVSVSPTSSTNYTLTCVGSGATVSKSVAITVNTAPVAPTVTLSANPALITSGKSSTLTWSSTNATSCTGTGFSTGNKIAGSVSVSPTSTTIYTLTCAGSGVKANKSTTITVAKATSVRGPFATPPSLPANPVYSAHFDKMTLDGFETSGLNVTYSDLDATNADNTFRGMGVTGQYPQLWPITGEDGVGWKVGSNKGGEWREYTISVPKSVTVIPHIRVASLRGVTSNPAIEAKIGNATMNFIVPNTGSWNAWQTVTAPSIILPAGQSQVLRVTQKFAGADWHRIWFEVATPPAVTLSASPVLITSGKSSTLTWSSTNATSCTGKGFSTGNKLAGSVSVSPTSSTNYTLTCVGSGATVSKSVAITVNTAPVAPTATLSANPALITSGKSSTLTWSSTNATSCTGTGFSTGNKIAGSVSVSPTKTTSYTVTCVGGGNTVTKSAQVSLSNEGPGNVKVIHFGFEPGQSPYPGGIGGLNILSENINNPPTISQEQAFSGQHAMKSYVHIYDSEIPWRSQASLAGKVKYRFDEGVTTPDYWVGFAVWIPSNFPRRNPQGNMHDEIFDVHTAPAGEVWGYCGESQPITLAWDQVSPTSGYVMLNLTGGTDFTNCENVKPKRKYVIWNRQVAQYNVGEWNTIVMNFRFDTTHGFFKLWVNGKLSEDYKGTLYHAKGTVGNPYPKWGFYLSWKDRITYDPNIVDRTSYYDDIRISDDPNADYATVAPK